MSAAKWEKRKTKAGTPYWIRRGTGDVTPTDPERKNGTDVARRAQSCDLVQLPEEMINPKGITALLAIRYAEDNIYTWAGASHTVLVAINPFKPLNIYTPSYAFEFIKQGQQDAPYRRDSVAVIGTQTVPHTFAVATEAFLNLRQGNQALLISGESGAGKTETTKHCLTLLAEAASDNGLGNLEQKVLCANPVLEAYGNASTTANDNSSRFGKWIKLMFTKNGELQGAKIETYLLEKSRVAIHNEGERGFHIFYQLAASRMLLPAELDLDEADEFRYLQPVKMSAVDDSTALQDVQNALEKLAFRDEEVMFLWRTAAAVMHLGQMHFEAHADEEDGSRISGGPLALVADLLGFDTETLEKALTSKAIEVRGEITWSPVGPGEAKLCADALARTLHGETFRWLVERINESLQGPATADRFIGILDIFGFEIFELNSFEQLCINFVNEKLQEHFNTNTFMEEQGLYQAEGIPFTSLEYVDNIEVLALLEGEAKASRSVGLLPLLDDMCRVPNGSERGFLDKCITNFKSFKSWTPPKQHDDNRFTINHYAGCVTYNVAGFMDKNRDQTMFAHIRLLKSSQFDLLRNLVPPESQKKTLTASANLRRQLGELMATIRACSAKYIRCIKPNIMKIPGKLDAAFAEEQLRYGGVFETVNIRKRGLPFRIVKEKFVNCYRCICLSHPITPMKTIEAPWARMHLSDAAEAILKFMGAHQGQTSSEDALAAAVGTTTVFYRTEVHARLELLRHLALQGFAVIVYRALRRYIGKKFRRAAVEAQTALARSLEMPGDLDEANLAVDVASDPILQLFRYVPARLQQVICLRDELQERADVADDISTVLKRFDENVERNARTLMHCMSRNMKLDKRNVVRSAAQDKLHMEAKRMVRIHGSKVLERQITKACKLPVRSVLEEILRIAATIEYEGEALKEVHQLLELSEVDFTKIQLERANQSGLGTVAMDLRIRLVQLKAEMCPEKYVLSAWPMGLRNPKTWFSVRNMPAVRTGFFTATASENDRLSSMYRFQDWPIHASILEKSLVYRWHSPPVEGTEKAYKDHDARVLHRNILGYMGDRRHPYPETLAVEVVKDAVGSLSLANEIFAQVMKQLTGNPSQASEERGWQLMALLLLHVAPSSELECDLVAGFIWLNAPHAIRMTLLDRLFEQFVSEKRKARLLELSAIPEHTRQLWAKSGGRPSLKLPRGSRALSGLEGIMADCD